MNKIKEIGAVTGIGTVVVLVILWLVGVFTPVKLPLGEQAGTTAGFASSSNATIGVATVGIVGTTTCSARIVTTQAVGVSLSFFDQPLDATHLGEFQAASTTVSYPSNIYGCGEMRARSAATTIIQIKDVN